MTRPVIMIGVTTMNRPRFLDKSIRAIRDHAAPLCDAVFVHNDGSDKKYHAEYARAYNRIPEAIIQDSEVNEGVAKSKNALLRAMLDAGADYLFLIEDDILIKSPDAITGYVNACKKSKLPHLAYAHHGPANAGGAVDGNEMVMYYTHSVGAFAIFTKKCLKTVGLFDENMLNAMEHVEWEMRAFQMGVMPNCGPHRFPDARGSDQWLTEIKGSLENSSIRPRADWSSNIRNSLIYWRDEKPETFALLFGEGMPLYNYAQSLIA